MPGTIQVSVLEFKGIASSSPPSSVYIKVSLGKAEYQAWDKGDFSFPLTTLRDSLNVTIQVPEGNIISKIGVHSMEIVEKGIWDALFPLEGGGHVHMKLQFSLSEEERNRIRGMRESALKKKQQEELSKDVRYSKMASDAGNSVASSSPINHEVSGAGKEAGFPFPDPILRDLQSNNGKEETTLQKHIAPNATDNSEESSSSKMLPRTEVHHMPVKKNDTELPHFVVSEAPNLSKDNSLISRDTESAVAKIKPVLSRLEDTPVNKLEKQFPLRKPASSIMKMISAFETTLVQEKKTPNIQVATKSQSNRARKEGPLKDQVLSHVTKAPESNSERPEYLTDLSSERLGNEEVSGRLLSPPQISSERLGNPSTSGKLQQVPPDSMSKGKHIGFHDDIGEIESSAATRQLLISSKSNVQQAKAHETVTSELNSDHKEIKNQRVESPEVLRETYLGPRKDKVLPEIRNRGEHVDFARGLDDDKLSQGAGQVTESSAIKVESAEVDATMKSKSESNNEESNKDQDYTSTDERSSASEASIVLKQMKEKGSVKLQPSNVYDWQKGSDRTSFVEGLREVKTKYSNEFLMTSNKKQNTVVSYEDEQHQHESSTAWIFPNDVRRMCVTTGVTAVIDVYDGCQAGGKAVGSEEMKESESASLNSSNTEPESWVDNAFTGSVKQAIKIAIVVGFGALVLFTRQREPRKSSRKGNDPFFSTLPCKDIQTTIAK